MLNVCLCQIVSLWIQNGDHVGTGSNALPLVYYNIVLSIVQSGGTALLVLIVFLEIVHFKFIWSNFSLNSCN